MKGRKTSITKKLMALCLMIIFVCSMSLNTFAAINADSTGTVTVTGLESDNGAALQAYKIIDIHFDTESQQLKEPVYTWNDSVAEWVKTNYSDYVKVVDTVAVVSDEYMKASGSELKNFYSAMDKAGILTNPAATVTMENQTATMNLPMGQYVISASKDGKVYSLITANVYPNYKDGTGWEIESVTVALKGSAPGIDKSVDTEGEGETDKTVAVGDIVPYKIVADIPVYPEDAVGKLFKIGDTLSKGLTLDKESIQVFAGDVLLTRDTEYTVGFDLVNPSRTFEIPFKYDNLKNTAGNATNVTVKYKAIVNENAFTVDDLGNTAFVGYQTDPYDENSYKPGEEDKEIVYTYGIDLTKKDKEDERTLAGAEFELRKDPNKDPLNFVETGEGVYRPVKDGEDGSSTLKVSEAGKLQVQGIDIGTYYLKETKAPDGYVLPDKDVVIVLNDTDLDGTLDDSSVTINKSDVASVMNVVIEKNTILFDLFNTSSKDGAFLLPTTGGAGTLLFSVIGVVLMGAAVAMVIVLGKKRRNS